MSPDDILHEAVREYFRHATTSKTAESPRVKRKIHRLLLKYWKETFGKQAVPEHEVKINATQLYAFMQLALRTL